VAFRLGLERSLRFLLPVVFIDHLQTPLARQSRPRKVVDTTYVPTFRAFDKRSPLLSPGTCCDRLRPFLERYEELARLAVHSHAIFPSQPNAVVIEQALDQELFYPWSVDNNVGIGCPVDRFTSHYSRFDFSEFHFLLSK